MGRFSHWVTGLSMVPTICSVLLSDVNRSRDDVRDLKKSKQKSVREVGKLKVFKMREWGDIR